MKIEVRPIDVENEEKLTEVLVELIRLTPHDMDFCDIQSSLDEAIRIYTKRKVRGDYADL